MMNMIMTKYLDILPKNKTKILTEIGRVPHFTGIKKTDTKMEAENTKKYIK